MEVQINDDFDLEKIAQSGQCFRWIKVGKDSYRIPHKGHVLNISCHPTSNTLIMDCTKDAYETLWHPYFDISTNYSAIRHLIAPSDVFLLEASAAGAGIRILQQDPFEMLMTFILSQRKSIPAIQLAIEKLCMLAGKYLGTYDNQTLYAFPTAEGILQADEAALRACGLGYRYDYIVHTAQTIASGAIDLAQLNSMPDEQLFDILNTFHGVGPKVALCTMLFGFSRLNAFPKDVWIIRVLEDRYPNGFDFDRHHPYNGVMQQYLFYYYRKIHQKNAPKL